MITKQKNSLSFILIITFTILMLNLASYGQTITTVSPDNATQGDSNVEITIEISASNIPLPPSQVLPQEVKIGNIVGKSVSRQDSTIIALFNFPLDFPAGSYEVSVSFPTPPDQGGQPLVFSKIDAFTIKTLENTPVKITSNPNSKEVHSGDIASFKVKVYGSLPITYKWQKNGADLEDSDSDTFIIQSVTSKDTGYYRCIVSNSFGSDTSETAHLSFSPKTYEGNYPIVDTDQNTFFDTLYVIEKPSEGEPFYGQDANYYGNQPSYTNNGDGTVTDNVTGLMWQQSLDHNGDGNIDVKDKLSYQQILEMLNSGYTYAGYSDWRLPTIKELYSLMNFSGRDISGLTSNDTTGLKPFINNSVFEFNYGDINAGERMIDVQCATTSRYVADTGMVFGVNFADGRIKGYGTTMMGQPKLFNYLLVRGNEDYGINNFVDNGDGTITDKSTGLMWMKDDNGKGLTWQEALEYAENFEYAGYSDWRLPNIKELQSILDYSRSPETSNSAAINPVFNTSVITNEAGKEDYPWYWSSTTHANNGSNGKVGGWAAYMAFGRALGNVNGWIDVHGAGAQRSDPKSGDPSKFSEGHGPQGDAVRIFNYVRLVRGSGGSTKPETELKYNIIETGQTKCYDENGNEISAPLPGEDLYGQDAQFPGTQFSYDVSNGIVMDNNTGLMWQQVPSPRDFTWQEAKNYCDTLTLGGYTDWRMPSAKELYSISNFEEGWPYLDQNYFSLASNIISKDEQYWTCNYYVGQTVEGGKDAAFGVNHVTGHIKAYAAKAGGPVGGKYVRAVRGKEYGINEFVDNGDGTISDKATGLMWAKDDFGVQLDWKNALKYAEDADLAGYTDWRLPNVKELQSIVDYSYSPTAYDTSKTGPAINPLFKCTPITNEAGNPDYGYYWTSTSAHFTSGKPFYYAWYVAFGTAVNNEGLDFHGAGAVRFDTKVEGGPLGEGGERYYNFVRLVRNINNTVSGVEDENNNSLNLPDKFELKQNFPNPFNPSTNIEVTVPKAGVYTLKVYNILGEEVTTLFSGRLNAGSRIFTFNASNLSSGIYFYNFRGENISETRKMMLLK